MKSKLKILKLAIMSIILFVLLFLIMANIMEEPAQKMLEARLSKEKLMANGSITNGTYAVEGAHNSNYFYKNGQFYYEYTLDTCNKVYTPSINDIQLYCIQKGGPLRATGNTVDYIKSLDGTIHSIGCIDTLPEDKYSNTYYVCVGAHSNLGAIGAFITTAPSNYIAEFDGVYSYGNLYSEFKTGENISEEVRQVAIWINPATNKGESFEACGAQFSYLEQAQQLSDNANEYEEYETELNENIDEVIKNTTTEDVKINVNTDEQYVIIGPYKLDYVQGTGTNITFSGITDIKVKGYNDKEKQQFIKDAELIGYIQNGEEKTLKYFTPTEENGYVDYKEQSYPVSGQEFYLKIKNPNQSVNDTNKKINYIGIEVDYGYMTVTGTKCELLGNQLIAKAVETEHNHSTGTDANGNSYNYHVSRKYQWKVSNNPIPQQFMMDAWGERNYYTLTIKLGDGDEETPLDITMNLGGYAWEDALSSKTSTADGINSTMGEAETADKPIKNVKVTLYECILDKNGKVQYENGQIVSQVANLLSDTNKKEMSEEEKARRVNPQLTDYKGYYQFDGLDSSNKYYVTFEYNGQVYMPTEYLVTGESNGKLTHANSVQDMVVNAKLYNTNTWKITSKIAEDQDVRESFDSQFAEIGSSPKNYKSSNSLQSGALLKEGNSYYNETFTIYNLMGFELQADGTYKHSGQHLIDSFYTINEKGNLVISNSINEGIISIKINEYIKNNFEYPDEAAMAKIYSGIAGNDKTSWKKLQFIEDCKMLSYTATPFNNTKIDLYPVYDDFTVDSKEMTIPGVGTKPAIYDGQYYVNAGLWPRTKSDLALRKDVYKAVTRINGKTEVYNYDKRNEAEYWEIELRMQDYANYYGTSYNRELYTDDYNYRASLTNLSGKDLELYVTYKIEVRNNAGILANVTEVVDYYDKDYIYQPNLSWVMYKDSNKEDYTKVSVSKDSYYNMMHNLSDATKTINYARNASANETSIYGESTHSDLEQQYNSLYINGISNKTLETGESAYIYLTFKVNSDEKGPVILDDDNTLKQNYAEINGYKTCYRNNTRLPNDVIKSYGDIAGIIDYNSTPGNLYAEDLIGEKYEKNFENDTDRAKSIKVTLDNEAIRNIEGVVWEDERTEIVSNSVIGDGVRQNDEIGVNGVTVLLVEKLDNGKEYIWQTAVTKDSGKYKFSNIIPGNYIVRFVYGNSHSTILTIEDGGENAVSYNGQDFKSTIYQKDMNSNKEIAKISDEYYDIKASDEYKGNLSDAKDLWNNKTVSARIASSTSNEYTDISYNGRENVNEYSTNNVTNHKAEVLASPYANTLNKDHINELAQNTNMTAETAIIILETEYNRTNTDGNNDKSNGKENYLNGNDYNGKYTLYNVDFGLTERPKAQLELDKKVAKVKLTYSNGTIAFDTTQSVTDVVWLAGKAYNLDDKMNKNKYEDYYKASITDSKYHRYSYRSEVDKLINSHYTGNDGLIQISLDEELMHGATVEITYNLKVKNVSETDYTGQDFYYKGNVAEGKIVTTTANQVIDYVPNNLQYRNTSNEGWTIERADQLTNSLVNTELAQAISGYNTILSTTSLNTVLKPGSTTEAKQLVLSQVITPENKNDDLTYENIAEIVQTSNTVGRRMAYSIVGNQNPAENPQEVDSSKAERVVILPPTGSGYMYLGLATIVITIITAGIVIIKKKVL